MQYSFLAILILGISPIQPAALAGGDLATAEGKAAAARNDTMEMDYQKSMKMDEPMPTGMAKPGMKKGDVKTSAEKKQTEMEEMMREEMK